MKENKMQTSRSMACFSKSRLSPERLLKKPIADLTAYSTHKAHSNHTRIGDFINVRSPSSRDNRSVNLAAFESANWRRGKPTESVIE